MEEPAEEPIEVYIARRRRQNVAIGLLATLGAVGLAGWWIAGDSIERWWRYDRPGLFAEASGDVPYERIHAELLPGWALKLGGKLGEGRQDLLAALSGDPKLHGIAREMIDLAQEDPWSKGQQLIDLCAAWTEHLDEVDQPWLVECNVVDAGGGAFFYVKSYKVVADARVAMGEERHRVRLLRRVDKTNVRETYLGHAGSLEGGARVVTDRIVESAMDGAWPRIGGADRLGEALTKEAGAALTAGAFEVLRATGPTRRAMLEAAALIDGKPECGGLRLSQLPARGYPEGTNAAILEAVERSGTCPAEAIQGAAALQEGARALAEVGGLDEALSELNAWLARAVIVHEVRHMGDQAAVGEGALPCPGCAEEAAEGVLREASAYLASFAEAGVGAIALVQACEATGDDRVERAMALIIQAGLGDVCAEGPPEDLNARAAAIEEKLFGRSQRIKAPAVAPF